MVGFPATIWMASVRCLLSLLLVPLLVPKGDITQFHLIIIDLLKIIDAPNASR
jgi:hypothetical protein